MIGMVAEDIWDQGLFGTWHGENASYHRGFGNGTES